MDKQKIINLLDKINNSEKNEIYHLISEIKNSLNESVNLTQNKEFQELKKMLNSDEWPEALMSFQICDENSEDDKMDRAEGIVDMLIEGKLEDKKFLDFGCGEGHVAKYVSSQRSKISVGYDIEKSNNLKFVWEEKQDNFLLTADFNKIQNEGPYDVILIFDVLDHAEDPVSILKNAKSLLSDDGKIYLRCHPWCGRHGGHLYRQINKAFVHLVFNEKELVDLGINLDKTIKNKVIYPIAEYEKYISDSELIKISMEIDSQDPEEFFSKNHLISERIKMNIPEKKGTKKREVFPDFQIKQCFLDFVLKNK